MAKYHPNKEINAAIEEAVSKGWRFERLDHGHTCMGYFTVDWQIGLVVVTMFMALQEFQKTTPNVFENVFETAAVRRRRHE